MRGCFLFIAVFLCFFIGNTLVSAEETPSPGSLTSNVASISAERIFYSYQDAQHILHQILVITPYLKVTPTIELFDSFQPNAFFHPPNRIKISSALLEQVQTHDELAFIIGHELGHLLFEHDYQGKSYQEAAAQEVIADSFGLQLIAQAGYQPEKAILLLARLQEITLQDGSTLNTVFPLLKHRASKVFQRVDSPPILRSFSSAQESYKRGGEVSG